MRLTPEQTTRCRRIDVKARDEHRRGIPGSRDDERVGLQQVQLRQHARVEVRVDTRKRRMEAAEHSMGVADFRSIVGPMPSWLSLRAIQHMETLTRPRRLFRQGVEERSAVRSRDIGENDEQVS